MAPPQATPGGERGEQEPLEGGSAAGVELPDVTPARIDAFLAYQGRRLELEQALWADLAAEGGVESGRGRTARRRREAGTGAPSAGALRRLEDRAEEDAQALEAAGLTPAELVSLGALIREVLGPRQLVRELGLEETATLLEEQAERLEGAQQEELLKQVEPLKERMNTLRALADVREIHGDAAVEAVLAREEALLAWQEARLSALLQDPGGDGEGQAAGRQ